MIRRPALVAAGPMIGGATVILAGRGAGAPGWLVVALVVVAGAGLWVAADRGGDVALALGLGAVGVAATTGLGADGLAPEVVLWAAGAVAAGEATGLAARSRSTAVPDAAVVDAEVARAAAVVAATLVGGLVLLAVGSLPAPGGLVGEVVALTAVVAVVAVGAIATGRRRSPLRAPAGAAGSGPAPRGGRRAGG
ncbi:hypothetical protein HC251_01030 [Iamia sp. SCSIO 61187]|uniref:hypothetical protein n=1 Tax=Iamia sp. SCSIO 61187 TaxID=2722752 RepID=UPI001C633261|nr:hypothetical protein [Iamia sp. SCSIO 61187]QYG91155.1 hypothetical protein HC251_01030 [Iamia sp. SCSIO 61187]